MLLIAGTHNQDDITWIKHECAERHHELKYGAGYSESHARAQSRTSLTNLINILT